MRALAIMIFSISAFDIPMAFMGYTALSLLRTIMCFDAAGQGRVEDVIGAQGVGLYGLKGKNSQDGTCFSAAAWNTKSTPCIGPE